jgi:hypothetical protein
MDRNKYLCIIVYKYSPAVLRETKVCYVSHKKSPENYCECQWLRVQYSYTTTKGIKCQNVEKALWGIF